MDQNINMNRYVDITSGLLGGTVVSQGRLIGNLITGSSELPADSFIKFSQLSSVGDYFGYDSDEYKYSEAYFGFVSKSVTKAEQIMFTRSNLTDANALIMGGTLASEDLAKIQAITAGGFTISIGGNDSVISSIDFSTATSFTDVASILETALQGVSELSAFTVDFDAVKSRLEIMANAKVQLELKDSVESTMEGLKLIGIGAKISQGSDAKTFVETLTDVSLADNSFGSFALMENLAPNNATVKEIAQWNFTQNNQFQYYPSTDLQSYASLSTELSGIDGTWLILSDDHLFMLPMAIMASTDYEGVNTVQNYMYQSNDAFFTASVTSDANADALDQLGISYYGRTQKSGIEYSFLQRGINGGAGKLPRAMGVFANEQWLKGYIQAQIMSLFLNSNIPADAEGEGMITSLITGEDGACDKAIQNGTFELAKSLTALQRVEIAQITGDKNASLEIQNKGYYFSIKIEQETASSGATEYVAKYKLVYSKGDQINKVEGQDILV
jgi:hypothetical protein